jgi:hypothetical protein
MTDLSLPHSNGGRLHVVNSSGHSCLPKNGTSCKDKWEIVYGDFKWDKVSILVMQSCLHIMMII